jgi:hypothetical protein
MIVAPAAGSEFVAHSYDNEGHVIDYRVIATDTVIVLTSLPDTTMPRFRLTYRPRGTGYMETFEIAPPGRPEAFESYVSGTLRRAR